MGNSPPATDISWDAAFLLRVIPNMVRWVYEGAWEPSSMVVWVLTCFSPSYNRFEFRTLLHSNNAIITRSVFVIELTSSLQGVRHCNRGHGSEAAMRVREYELIFCSA